MKKKMVSNMTLSCKANCIPHYAIFLTMYTYTCCPRTAGN